MYVLEMCERNDYSLEELNIVGHTFSRDFGTLPSNNTSFSSNSGGNQSHGFGGNQGNQGFEGNQGGNFGGNGGNGGFGNNNQIYKDFNHNNHPTHYQEPDNGYNPYQGLSNLKNNAPDFHKAEEIEPKTKV